VEAEAVAEHEPAEIVMEEKVNGPPKPSPRRGAGPGGGRKAAKVRPAKPEPVKEDPFARVQTPALF